MRSYRQKFNPQNHLVECYFWDHMLPSIQLHPQRPVNESTIVIIATL